MIEFQAEISIADILLEEVEKDLDPSNSDGWLSAFGFDFPIQRKSSILEAIKLYQSRKYRYVKLDKDGKFYAFEIREFKAV